MQEQHNVVLWRLEQYRSASADDRAFQKRYMTRAFEVPRRDFKRIDQTLPGDTGVYESTAEGFARLIWGHPQGPTTLRSIIELIEDPVVNGGGYGLFTGCAAGDSAMAVVLRVSGR
jgi:hypothetical protein